MGLKTHNSVETIFKFSNFLKKIFFSIKCRKNPDFYKKFHSLKNVVVFCVVTNFFFFLFVFHHINAILFLKFHKISKSAFFSDLFTVQRFSAWLRWILNKKIVGWSIRSWCMYPSIFLCSTHVDNILHKKEICLYSEKITTQHTFYIR